MVKYSLNGINRLVAFGCSFTAGCELLDHTLDEKYVKLKSKADSSDWYSVISKDKEAMDKLISNREREKNLSWAAKLAKQLGLEFVSYAQVGNSNEKMIWQIEKAIYEGKILPTDLIIVGLTSPHRSMAFNIDNEEPIPFLFSNNRFIETRYKKSLYSWFDDSRIVWDYIRNLESFNLLKKKLNGRLFVASMEFPFAIGINHYYSLDNLGHQATFFRDRIDELLNSDLFIGDSNYLYGFCLRDNEKLEHGHPAEKAHQLFANALVPYFIKKS